MSWSLFINNAAHVAFGNVRRLRFALHIVAWHRFGRRWAGPEFKVVLPETFNVGWAGPLVGSAYFGEYFSGGKIREGAEPVFETGRVLQVGQPAGFRCSRQRRRSRPP